MTDTTNPGEATETPELDQGVDNAPIDHTSDEPDELEGIDGEGLDEPDSNAEDVEDIEVEGKAYKIPKAVKPLLLMQADYTRKTQAVAERSKALESREAEITQKAEFQKANIAQFAELHTIDSRLSEFQAVTQDQWEALKAKDIDAYRELKDEYRDAKEARDKLAGDLSAKETESNAERERTSKEEIANQQRAMLDVILGAAKHENGLDLTIPNLTKERLGKISEHAGSAYGFSADELSQITDPRILKALDDARIGRLALSKRSKVEQVEASQRTTPAKTVNGAAPGARKASDATGDALRAEEWMKRRNEDLARRRAKP